MLDVMTCIEIRADARAEWQRAKQRMEMIVDRGGADASYLAELCTKISERERAYRRIDMICKRNGIPDEK